MGPNINAEGHGVLSVYLSIISPFNIKSITALDSMHRSNILILA